MLFTPYFGGCKYTNNFLFINNIIEIQYFEVLITPCSYLSVKIKQLFHHIIRKFLYIWEL